MTLPVPKNHSATSPTRTIPVPSPVRPLGAADWLPAEQVPSYKPGDLWLGRSALGSTVGISDDRNICIVAAPRNGKDTSYVITNISRWLGSVPVIDPKGENAIVTARRRGGGSKYSEGLGQKVYVIDPYNVVKTNEDTFCDLKVGFNPLDMLNVADENAPDLADQIAETLVGDELSQGDPYWPKEAKAHQIRHPARCVIAGFHRYRAESGHRPQLAP